MRRLLIFILCLSFVFTISVPTSAAEATQPEWIHEETIYSEPFIVPELVGNSAPGNVSTLAYGERTVVGDIFTTNKVIFVYPEDQPSLGFEGTDDAYASFFYTSGSTVTFTITIESKYFTFTADTGYYVASGGAYSARIPTTSGRYRLKFKKDYLIKTVRYDVYSGGDVYEYSYFTHDPKYSLTHWWVKIG